MHTIAGETRRTWNLERNRSAVRKYRQRTNMRQVTLESKTNELESRRKELRSATKELIEEVAQLKNAVMTHAFCNDANIDNWIQNQADSLTRSRARATASEFPQQTSQMWSLPSAASIADIAMIGTVL